MVLPARRHPPDSEPFDGAWFHVTHRAVGRRPLFPEREDVQAYMELLAEQVRLGQLEVHAFSLLTTHLHLLVRARPAGLSEALRRAGAVYARRLNRRLRRVGPVFGGRPFVLRVRSAAHWRAVLAYIDLNAVEAGLADTPCRYPWGSAWHYARRSGPPWLARGVVEDWVRQRAGDAAYRPGSYGEVVHAGVRAREVAARRQTRPPSGGDPLDGLLSAAPAQVRAWLERRARAADGVSAGPVLVSPRALDEAVARARVLRGPWPLARRRPGRRPSPVAGRHRDAWAVLLAGLLRSASGLALQEIGDRLGYSVAGAHGLVACHVDLVAREPAYASVAQHVLREALTREHGTREGAGRGPN